MAVPCLLPSCLGNLYSSCSWIKNFFLTSSKYIWNWTISVHLHGSDFGLNYCPLLSKLLPLIVIFLLNWFPSFFSCPLLLHNKSAQTLCFTGLEVRSLKSMCLQDYIPSGNFRGKISFLALLEATCIPWPMASLHHFIITPYFHCHISYY